MKLKSFRKKRNLTLDQLSEITGISRSTLSRIENNPEYQIKLSLALILTNYFPELSLEDLNNGKKPPYPSMQNVHDATKTGKTPKVLEQ
jgi:transcriptional regulator with XRE-family HTH domain